MGRVSWVCAEAIETEDATSDKATECAFRVCGGGWDVEVEILWFFVNCSGDFVGSNGDCEIHEGAGS